MHKATERTRDDLNRAMKDQRPVTITYTRADGSETVRTIEIYEEFDSRAGDILFRAMDRETGESRSWRLDRIRFYTVHRMQYIVQREES